MNAVGEAIDGTNLRVRGVTVVILRQELEPQPLWKKSPGLGFVHGQIYKRKRQPLITNPTRHPSMDLNANSPSTGRTLGKDISKLGSAGRMTAILSSQVTAPWRFLLQSASQSRASCTSLQVTFPLKGHASHTIISMTIQLAPM